MDIITEKQMVKKASIIRICKERELQLALYVTKSFEQYTTIKTGRRFIVQRNVGARGQQKIENVQYAEKSFKHPQKEIKSIAQMNAEI